MIKLGLNIDEDPIIADEEVDMPTLEDDVDEGSWMEEVD
jgi:molecular chaperone HtpG